MTDRCSQEVWTELLKQKADFSALEKGQADVLERQTAIQEQQQQLMLWHERTDAELRTIREASVKTCDASVKMATLAEAREKREEREARYQQEKREKQKKDAEDEDKKSRFRLRIAEFGLRNWQWFAGITLVFIALAFPELRPEMVKLVRAMTASVDAGEILEDGDGASDAADLDSAPPPLPTAGP